jgi:hypothetical protein
MDAANTALIEDGTFPAFHAGHCSAFLRVFQMPSKDTFDVPALGHFVRRYLRASKVSIDPFARNKDWATYTNDINPHTSAQYHMDAAEFLRKLADDGVTADLVILDPPYSPRQITDSYAEAGIKATMRDTQNARLYAEVKREVQRLVPVGGVVLSFGWNTAGMQSKGEWQITEGIIVCHGAGRNDTLAMAERRMASQGDLFMQNARAMPSGDGVANESKLESL